MNKNEHKLSLIALIGIMVSKVVGSGIFNLMKEMGRVASPGSMLIGWGISALGMGLLVVILQYLNEKRPDLDAGIFSYAQEGFGNYVGFNSIWGYWISNIIGNAAYGTLFFATVSYFFPQFGGGENILSVICASAMLWLIYYKISKGLSSAALLNTVVLIAKSIPILLFIIIVGRGFSSDIFLTDFWGNLKDNLAIGVVSTQIKNTMLVTVWTFVGIEGAVVFSGRAKKRSDVGKATLLGFFSVTLIYIMVTTLSYGVLPRQQLAELPNPAMGYVLEAFLGKWGAILVNIGVMTSVFGAWLSGTMLAQEVAYQAGIRELFPKAFKKVNDHHVPVFALKVTTLLVQGLFILFVFVEGAYSFFSQLSSAVILIPYLLVVLFFLKELTKDISKRYPIKESIVGVICLGYMLWLFYASGSKFLLLDIFTIFPGTLLYIYTRWQYKRKLLKSSEWALLIIICGFFLYGLLNLSSVFNI